MNPRGAILGLAIATTVGASGTTLVLPAITVYALVAVGVIASLLLNHLYAKSLGHLGRPFSRVPLDRLVSTEVAGAFVPPLLVALAVALGVVPVVQTNTAFAVIVGVVTLAVEICFLSSLVDWYYVLPRRDGLVCTPPCRTPADERWQGVTWFWFLHRFVAATAVMASAYAAALCVGFWLVARYPDAVGAAGGIPVILFAISYFRREYLRDMGKVWSALFSPVVSLGEQLSIWRNGRTVTGFVLNVSIDRVDLLDAANRVSHVKISDVVEDSSRSTKSCLCAEGCVRGNADRTKRAPVGGHGGCLAETPVDKREPSRARRRLFVV